MEGRVRRHLPQETAIEPRAQSTPEFLRIERPEPARSPTAHEQSSCSCPTQSSWPRSCARLGSHPYASTGVIAGKHSAPEPREMPRKQMPPQTHARDLSDARTCSLRCDLLTVARLAQEISAKSDPTGTAAAPWLVLFVFLDVAVVIASFNIGRHRRHGKYSDHASTNSGYIGFVFFICLYFRGIHLWIQRAKCNQGIAFRLGIT
jgi:hypothetical protein